MKALILAALIASAQTEEPTNPPHPVNPIFECVEQTFEEFKLKNPDADEIDYEMIRRLCGFVPNQQIL